MAIFKRKRRIKMKFSKLILLSMLVILLAHGIGRCQDYNEKETNWLFNSSNATLTGITVDSVSRVGTNTYYTLNTVAAQADTAISQYVGNDGGGNDITVYVLADSVAGTTSIEAFFGIYRGAALGWLWNSMGTIATDGGSITFDVAAQSYGPYRVIDVWGIKLEETGNQRNLIHVRTIKFEW
jgi:hypothetical protein